MSMQRTVPARLSRALPVLALGTALAIGACATAPSPTGTASGGASAVPSAGGSTAAPPAVPPAASSPASAPPSATASPSLPSPTTSADPSPGQGGSALVEALTFVPPGSDHLMFTDWARIKADQDAGHLTGASPIDDKLPVLLSVNQQHASATGFGLRRVRGHYETWGWDTLDLTWEAQWLDEAPVWALRFREGIDFATTLAVMDEAGFETRTHAGATIRSHRLDLQADWATTTELAIANTAFLPDGMTLLTSSSPDALERALDTRAGGAPDAPATGLATALGDGNALMMLLGSDACQSLRPTPGSVSQQVLDELLQQIRDAGLEPYDAFAVGYETVDGRPAGVIAFHFADGAIAQDQAGKREEIARNALSLRANRPYSEVVFTVTRTAIEEGYVFMAVEPAGGFPRRLFDALLTRDAWFAAC